MQRLMIILIAGLALWVSGPSQAQQPLPTPLSARDAALRLLATTGAAKQFDAIIPTMLGQFADMVTKQHPSHEKDIRDVFGRMVERMSQRKQEVIDQIADLYTKRFTAEELLEVDRFFSSGIGARFVQEQLGLTQESMAIGQRWGEKIGREIEAEALRDLKARGLPL